MRTSTLLSPIQAVSRVCRRCKSTTTISHEEPRLRFAPSPTGHLHLGGLRTALLNHLVARKGKGKWILRIEDTDRARFVLGAIDSLRSSLEWAGLEYDEGIGAGGNYGPYIQSERRDLYHFHVKQLLETDHAYECFCSSSDLDAIKTSLKAGGNRMSYDGRCRHLTDEERVRKKKAGESYIIRFKDPGGVPTMPEDLVFGEVKPHTDTGHANHDDFVLMKSDGYPTYHLASVVDDHEMRITHVLRGEEWLPSLPKHVALYNAFGWKFPHFAHLPLMVNSKGMKLSKRKDDVAIDLYREKGYEPEALLNFLGLLGWDHYAALEKTHGDMLPYHERNDKHSLYEIFSLPQLIQAFDLSHLSRRKAMVNIDKLDFINKMTLRRKAERLGQEGELVNLGKANVAGEGGERKVMIERYQADLRALPVLQGSTAIEDKAFVETVFDLELPRVVRLNEMAETSTYFFLDPDYTSTEATTIFSNCKEGSYVANLEAVLALLEDAHSQGSITTDTVWDVVRDVVKEHKLKARSEVMLQMRHALTGQKKGPSIPEVVVVLGLERSLARLRAGIDHVQRLHSS